MTRAQHAFPAVSLDTRLRSANILRHISSEMPFYARALSLACWSIINEPHCCVYSGSENRKSNGPTRLVATIPARVLLATSLDPRILTIV